ncbi:MAG: 30S ribosomal protein S8 [Lentisphaeria bacterium]|nr:30S ribosomal protein S8 [Lentisphaeria bacterium]
MSMSDPIADMLTRIRNAARAKLPTVSMPGSKMKMALSQVFQDCGFVAGTSMGEDAQGHKELTVELKYKGKRSTPVIEGIQRISKPSCRVYVGSGEIPRVLGGLGVAVLSTSQGIVSDRTARSKNIGGEVLCYIW